MGEDKEIAGIIIYNKSGDLLLQKKDMGYPWFPGKWCLFGGHVEFGENPETALERELQEEIGCRINPIRYHKTIRFNETCPIGTRKGNWHIYSGLFTGKTSDISLREGAGFAFFSPLELDSLNLVDTHSQEIKEVLSSLSYT